MASHHPSQPPETSSPVLWTVAMLVFIAGTAWWLRYQYRQGAFYGAQHPVQVKVQQEVEEIPDHAALIQNMEDLVKVGKQQWESNCATCHGIDGNPVQANARHFKNEALKWGADPYSMYVTIAQGQGAMPAQSRMTPEEVYGSIAYIRQNFFKDHNQSQFVEVTDEYLAAGEWPAPGVVASEGAGPTGAELKAKPLEIPVEGVMAEMADTRPDRSDQRSALHAVAAAVGEPLAAQLRRIADAEGNGAFVARLVASLKEGDQDAFVALVTRPGRNQATGSLAMVTSAQFNQLSQVAQSHQTGH